MAGAFDPYHTWLGISPKEQPPNYYRLLGIEDFEPQPEVIEHAADQRMAHLRTFQAGKHSALSQKLLNEVAAAKLCLLKPEKKAAYDAKLRAARAAKGESSDEAFAKQMAELLADTAPVRKRSSSGSRPPVRMILGGSLVGLLILGAGVWAFSAKKSAGRTEPDQSRQRSAVEAPSENAKPRRSAAPQPVAVAAPAKHTAEMPGPEAKSQATKPEEPKPRPVVRPPVVQAAAPTTAVAGRSTSPPAPQPVAAPAARSEFPVPSSELTKFPVPDAKALEEGLKAAREAYQEEYARAQTAVTRRELAKKILQQAVQSKDDPVARFVLLRLARDIAVHAQDAGLACEVIDRLADGFEIDPWPMRADVVVNAAKQARKAAEHKVVAEQALGLMRQALQADACTVAQEMSKLALAEAGKARDKESVAQARAGLKLAQQAAKALDQLEADRAILKDRPDDPAANTAVGRYECFIKGDWARGLARLAKAPDAALAALAKEDLKAPEDDAARLKLADAWWDLAQKAEAREKEGVLLRAGYWYRQLGEIDQPLVRTKVESRLAQIAKLGGAIAGPPAKTSVTNSIGMQFVLVPAGEFLMGSTPEHIVRAAEAGRQRNEQQWYFDRLPSETPCHRVRISRPFYLGMYEVTQAEYEQVMGVNPSNFAGKPMDVAQLNLDERRRTERESDTMRVAGQDTGRYPVEMVSWVDAAAFCQRLSALPKERAARRVYRLPTEAEWEYAARAGTTTRWFFGDDPAALGEYAWFGETAGGTTHPVGQKKPNAWGLHDMCGNVWEWCMDWFGQDHYRQSVPLDPVGPPSGSNRVLRGGAWLADPLHCPSAFRDSHKPAGRFHECGFRVVVVR